MEHPRQKSYSGVVCFTNSEQYPFVEQKGVYGNVEDGDSTTPAGRQIRFSKLRDLFCIQPDSLVFLFIRGQSVLRGVWQVAGEPYYCTIPEFDVAHVYPYRIPIARRWYFPNPVPVMELRNLLNLGMLWSIRSFERDPSAPFSSVSPLSSQETDQLLGLLWKYNHREDPSIGDRDSTVGEIADRINFHDLVMDDRLQQTAPAVLDAYDLGHWSGGQIYEYALHCYLAYNLARHTDQARRLFGHYAEVLREVPVSIAGQNRPDFVLVYEHGLTGRPVVYSVIEVKRGRVEISMLRQLLEYLRLLSDRLGLDLNSVEGIYLASGFDEEVTSYVRNRSRIETERPVRLIRCQVSGSQISLDPV